MQCAETGVKWGVIISEQEGIYSKMFGITWYFVSKESTERKSENCQSCQSICIQNKRRVVVALVSPVSAFNSPI